MKIIVGLGNPGKEYENTRHNIGFEIINDFLGNIIWQQNSYGYYYKEKNIIYLKPTTFMNLSGIAVNHFVKYYKIKQEDILIIHDDLDINIGLFKIKYNSSSGGHNGVQSILNSLKTSKLLRVKIGILNNKKIDSRDYVLGMFTKKEKETINQIKDSINNIINDFILNKSPEYLMNKYNQRK